MNKADDFVKIGDFGFAKRSDDGLVSPKGTTPYASPEQIVKFQGKSPFEKYDLKCDIWSIGVIMYILCCGKPPFYSFRQIKAAESPGMEQRIINGEYEFLDSEWKLVSPEAKQLVSRMLEPLPEKRLSIDQVINDKWFRSYPTMPSTPLPNPLLNFTNLKKSKNDWMRVMSDMNKVLGESRVRWEKPEINEINEEKIDFLRRRKQRREQNNHSSSQPVALKKKEPVYVIEEPIREETTVSTTLSTESDAAAKVASDEAAVASPAKEAVISVSNEAAAASPAKEVAKKHERVLEIETSITLKHQPPLPPVSRTSITKPHQKEATSSTISRDKKEATTKKVSDIWDDVPTRIVSSLLSPKSNNATSSDNSNANSSKSKSVLIALHYSMNLNETRNNPDDDDDYKYLARL